MNRNLYRPLAGGVAALVVAMGIGRFAYTPILPLMERQAGLSSLMAGYLGAANYLGYLVGALVAGTTARTVGRERLLKLSLVLTVAGTGAMGLWRAEPFWLALRLLAGTTSALVFVLASSLVLEALAARGRGQWSGIFYGGVGLGIVVTGLAVPLLEQMGGWRWAWGGLALLAIPLTVLPWWTLREGAPDPMQEEPPASVLEKSPASVRQEPPGDGGPTVCPAILPWLTAAYGLEGLGYIVTGTFLVSVVEQMQQGSALAAFSWALVGLAAMPSSYLWTVLADRWGRVKTLIAIFLVQAAGVALPALSPSPAGALLGSLLFGATFMGITALTLLIGRSIRPQESAGLIGRLTAVYGLGQVIGPAGAGILMATTGTYRVALLAAAAIVALGALLLLLGQRQGAAPYQFMAKENEHAVCEHQDHP